MTAAPLPFSPAWADRTAPAPPAPVLAAPPVLISDCATPLCHATLLSLLLARIARND